jgi:hypothetical protein
MKNYIIEIKDESKTLIIKELLLELGLIEINENVFVEKRIKAKSTLKKISQISPKN